MAKFLKFLTSGDTTVRQIKLRHCASGECKKVYGGGLFTKIPEILAQKNSEIIQESSRIFLSHSEEDYLRREREVIYDSSKIPEIPVNKIVK